MSTGKTGLIPNERGYYNVHFPFYKCENCPEGLCHEITHLQKESSKTRNVYDFVVKGIGTGLIGGAARTNFDTERHFFKTREGVNETKAPWRDFGSEICQIDGESICYTGRPKNKEDAKNIIKEIFLREMKKYEKSKLSGIVVKDPKGLNPCDGLLFDMARKFELTFIVQSLLSIYPIKERKMIADVFKSLSEAKEEIEVKFNGITYTILPNPIFLSRQLNFCSVLENVLSPSMSGKAASDFYTDLGINQIRKRLIENTTECSKAEEQEITQKIIGQRYECRELQLINDLLNNRGNNLLPEELIAVEYFITKFLNIPVVFHCKDSIDRTGFSVAIMKSLYQYDRSFLIGDKEIKTADALYNEIHRIFLDERFKELFLANLYETAEVSLRFRGKNGFCMGHKEIYGMFLELTVQDHFRRLLPERCLKPCSVTRKVAAAAFLIIFIIPIAILYFLSQLLFVIPNEIVKSFKSDPSACPGRAIVDLMKILLSFVFIYGFALLGYRLYKMITPKKINLNNEDMKKLMFFKKKKQKT